MFIDTGTLNAVRVFVDNVRATLCRNCGLPCNFSLILKLASLFWTGKRSFSVGGCVIIARNHPEQEAPALLNSGTEDLDAAMSCVSSYKVDGELVNILMT